MKFKITQIFWTVLGIIFFILGFIGIFLPIVPGPLFIIAGAICLGMEKKILNYYISKILNRIKKKSK